MVPRIGSLTRIAVLSVLLLLFTTYLALASDLPLIYRSEDKDLENVTTNVTNLTELAKYYDVLFTSIPDAVINQNEKAFLSFPLKGNSESAVPFGTQTRSSKVIKDAYVKLIPLRGFVQVDDRFYMDKRVEVGYLLDYRIELPPDVTDSYPKHYYYLDGVEVRVTLKSGDVVKESKSKRDVFYIDAKGDIVATATISVSYTEKVVELHESCYTTCDESGNCSTHCHYYEVTYYRHHLDSVNVGDVLKRFTPPKVKIKVIFDDSGNPVEQAVYPNEVTAYLSADDTPIVEGIRYVATYKCIKDYTVYSKSGSSTYALSTPFYCVLSVPSLTVSPKRASVEIVSAEYENATVANVPNFKPLSQLIRYKVIDLRYGKVLIPRDFFGNELKYDLIRERGCRVNVSVDVRKVNGAYEANLRFSYCGIPYEGVVYLGFRAHGYEYDVSDGFLSLKFNRSGLLTYLIPRRIPKNWYEDDEQVYPLETAGNLYVGEKMDLYSLGWKIFVILLSGVVPILLLYKVLKKYLREEEEEYI